MGADHRADLRDDDALARDGTRPACPADPRRRGRRRGAARRCSTAPASRTLSARCGPSGCGSAGATRPRRRRRPARSPASSTASSRRTPAPDRCARPCAGIRACRTWRTAASAWPRPGRRRRSRRACPARGPAGARLSTIDAERPARLLRIDDPHGDRVRHGLGGELGRLQGRRQAARQEDRHDAVVAVGGRRRGAPPRTRRATERPFRAGSGCVAPRPELGGGEVLAIDELLVAEAHAQRARW